MSSVVKQDGTKKDWIQAHPSGLKVHPLAPDPREFRIKDIAHHLSMQCRYAGAVRRFYSVAEHSVHVAAVVRARGSWEFPCRFEAWALIHDASEAYLNDITRPVKHAPELAGYRDAETRLQTAIAQWLGLVSFEPDIVKAVDNEILGTEARQLKSPVDPDWATWFPGGKLPAVIPGLRVGIWTPAQAKRRFLAAFTRLFPEHRE